MAHQTLTAEYCPPGSRDHGRGKHATAAGLTVRVVVGTPKTIRRMTPAQARYLAGQLVAAADAADAATTAGVAP